MGKGPRRAWIEQAGGIWVIVFCILSSEWLACQKRWHILVVPALCTGSALMLTLLEISVGGLAKEKRIPLHVAILLLWNDALVLLDKAEEQRLRADFAEALKCWTKKHIGMFKGKEQASWKHMKAWMSNSMWWIYAAPWLMVHKDFTCLPSHPVFLKLILRVQLYNMKPREAPEVKLSCDIVIFTSWWLKSWTLLMQQGSKTAVPRRASPEQARGIRVIVFCSSALEVLGRRLCKFRQTQAWFCWMRRKNFGGLLKVQRHWNVGI